MKDTTCLTYQNKYKITVYRKILCKSSHMSKCSELRYTIHSTYKDANHKGTPTLSLVLYL